MKVFVAGATGVLGRRVVPLLVAAGHDVTGVARSPAKADFLRGLGATAATVDLFDADAVVGAVAGHDVVCNLATHIPDLRHARRGGAWEETARLRTVASRNLVDAACAGGASRYVQESIAFLYADGGEAWIDEDAALVDGPLTPPVRAAEAEACRMTDGGGIGVVLRFGMFYGAGAGTTADQLRLAGHGIAPSLGPRAGYQSLIHLDDAAAAVVAALRAPPGTYNVVEDEPVTRTEQADAVAAALGADRLRHLPPAASRLAGGIGAHTTRSQRVSNARFRAATAWAPTYPDQWSGWRQVVAATPSPPRNRRGRELVVIAALVSLAVPAAVEGAWAALGPGSFFRTFPGTGRWVAAYPPYNEHLVRDVGDLSVAMVVLTVGALVVRRRSVVRLAGLAWFAEALPHLIFHLRNAGSLSSAQQLASSSGLGAVVALALVCLVAPPPDAPRPGVGPARP